MKHLERGELLGLLEVEKNRSAALWENLTEAWKKLQELGYCIGCMKLEDDCKCHEAELDAPPRQVSGRGDPGRLD